jgi:cbb3-type cytochrome oxidase maturation protein
MNALIFLIPLSGVLLVIAGAAFFWAADHGQFEDMDTSSLLPVSDADDAGSKPEGGMPELSPRPPK